MIVTICYDFEIFDLKNIGRLMSFKYSTISLVNEEALVEFITRASSFKNHNKS